MAVASQCGRGAIGPARKITRAQLLQWVREKISQGATVCTVYESCGFGYPLHEKLGDVNRQAKVLEDRECVWREVGIGTEAFKWH